MTAREFWKILARNGRTGGIIFVICVLGAMVLGWTSRPLYRATALFEITTAGFSSRDVGGNLLPPLDVSVLQGWLGQSDVLQHIIDMAGSHGQLTVAQLQPTVGVIAAGGANTFETSVLSSSPTQAQKLADATAEVLGRRAKAVIQSGVSQTLPRLRAAIARSQALMRDEGQANRHRGAPDEFAQLR